MRSKKKLSQFKKKQSLVSVSARVTPLVKEKLIEGAGMYCMTLSELLSNVLREYSETIED